MKKILIAAATLFAFPLAAHAADWTGPYVGATLGYGLGDTVIDDQDCNISCSSQTFSPASATYGVGAGYNYQMGSTVLGVEADWSGMNADKEATTNWPSHYKVELDSFWTLRARAGLALDRTLIYATAGFAGVKQSVEADSTSSGVVRHHLSVDETTTGMVYGGGLEFAVNGPWRAKMEYLHIALPGDNNIRDDGTSCPTQSYCNFGVKTSLDVVRFGANYAF
jgi:outer membrane immunogenic protein